MDFSSWEALQHQGVRANCSPGHHFTALLGLDKKPVNTLKRGFYTLRNRKTPKFHFSTQKWDKTDVLGPE